MIVPLEGAIISFLLLQEEKHLQGRRLIGSRGPDGGQAVNRRLHVNPRAKKEWYVRIPSFVLITAALHLTNSPFPPEQKLHILEKQPVAFAHNDCGFFSLGYAGNSAHSSLLHVGVDSVLLSRPSFLH